jgi:hypothetical protein
MVAKWAGISRMLGALALKMMDGRWIVFLREE